MKVRNFATHDVKTIAPEATLLQAARLMRQYHVGCLVVTEPIENGYTPVGILTDRDIVVEGVARNLPMADTEARDVMAEDIVTCMENDDVNKAIELMKRNGVRRLPVVDQEQLLVGLLSLDDLLEHSQEDISPLEDLPRNQRNWEREVRR